MHNHNEKQILRPTESVVQIIRLLSLVLASCCQLGRKVIISNLAIEKEAQEKQNYSLTITEKSGRKEL